MFGFPTRRAADQAVFLTASPHAAGDAASAAKRAAAVASGGMHLVHLLASSLRVDQSLSTAVRFAAAHAGGATSEELERLEWAVRLRHFASVDEGFLAFADAVGRADGELKRALVTLHGAEGEPTREGLERRLDRAYDIVVRAEERRREKLAASLERPVQTLFGLAVVLPLVLAALLPMIQLGSPGAGPVPAALLLIVAVPVLTTLGATRLLGRNFLGAPVSAQHGRVAWGAALAAPACGAAGFALSSFLHFSVVEPAVTAAIASGAGAFVAGWWAARGASAADVSRRDLERELPDLLHSVGTKMAAGRPAEHALLETAEGARASTLAVRLRGVLFDVIVGRRSLTEALERDEEVRQAPRVFPALRLLASTADRDTETAGRVVLHLSEFERLRAEATASLRAKLKALVETTKSTTTIFAPLVLGITAGMYGLLSQIGTAIVPGAGAVGPGESHAFALVVALYLCLEVAVADWFAARLISDRVATDYGRALARDIPLAMALFVVALIGSGLLF